MAKLRVYRVPSTVAFAAGGNIALECSPVPFTITEIAVVVHTDVTTTTATNYSDYWDRAIANLSLTGTVQSLNQQKTFMAFSNMRVPYHDSRFALLGNAPKRPTIVADSQTNALTQFMYLFHLGTRPFKDGGFLNRMDLTAGIPPTGKGQLSLGGAWGAAAAMGGSVTLNATASCFLEVYLIGVQAEEGDPVQLYTPQAFPVWSMQNITPAATSTMFSTSNSITAGNFLEAALLYATNGTNAPRDDQVLNSLRLYHQLENRDIISFGGKAGTADASGGDYKVAEFLTQLGLGGAPYSELPGTPGVPTLTAAADKGLVRFRFPDLTTKVHPLYGADLRKVATGDIRLDAGVADATGVDVQLLYKRYELNPEHPANAPYL